VKFDTNVKDAEVFIDGSYAGTVGKLKTMYLQPGSYNIELRSPGRTQFDKKIYVVAGKTLHLNPDLHVQAATTSAAVTGSSPSAGHKCGGEPALPRFSRCGSLPFDSTQRRL